jgi:anti-sigma regulatory factor (Ser/Thr protein kinase)
MEVEAQQRPGQTLVEVTELSVAGEARRAAVQCAESLGMDEIDRGRVAIGVTELATNLVKHAGTGKLVYEPVSDNGDSGIRVLCVDKGPGIRDISAALRDGYSTSGTSGSGLGAVRRLASSFDIYSAPEHGTCVLAEFWHKNKPAANGPFAIGVVSQPIRGESLCGDGWGARATADRSFFMLVDGLGHGVFAAEAAREAERVLAQTNATSAVAIIGDCHDALKKTRGAAVAIAAISKDKNTLAFAGVGNISATVLNGATRRGLASHNGTLGHHMHRLQEFTVPWNEHSILIMHSDGLGSKWDLNEYPGLSSKHPSIIAAILYRDFVRGRDDVTVLAAKNSQ